MENTIIPMVSGMVELITRVSAALILPHYMGVYGIYLAEVLQGPENRIYIELTGNGFLYNMVRIIAGTLVDVGLGKIKPEKIPEIIKDGDRKKSGKTLPPSGLFLMKVMY